MAVVMVVEGLEEVVMVASMEVTMVASMAVVMVEEGLGEVVMVV